MAHKLEKEFSLAPGQVTSVGRFQLKLKGFAQQSLPDYDALQAEVELLQQSDQAVITTLTPEMRFYRAREESTTEVALRMGLREDVYVVLAGMDPSGQKASLKVYINPLQVWLWFGAILMIVGTAIAMLPRSTAKLT
jgi:cytochrome c-type biogenesis protein CcmF